MSGDWKRAKHGGGHPLDGWVTSISTGDIGLAGVASATSWKLFERTCSNPWVTFVTQGICRAHAKKEASSNCEKFLIGDVSILIMRFVKASSSPGNQSSFSKPDDL